MTERENFREALSALARLHDQPRRFGFDAAVRLLLLAAGEDDPAEVLRFRSVPSLAYPPADVLSVVSDEGASPATVAVTVMGLVGPSGVLPRGYSEVVNATLRNRSRALHAFLDALSHRLVAHFARAGTKYRRHRVAEIAGFRGTADADPISRLLLSLTGYATAGMADRLAAGTNPLCHYAGFFAMRPRSADRLAALVADWCGRPVEVRQFAGAWVALPPDQRTTLACGVIAGRFDRLGIDAAIGVRAWDAQARLVLVIGPVDLTAFEALLPDRPALRRLVSLVRAFVGFETGFAVNPVLAAAAVPPLRLAEARLGWNTWLPTATPRRRPGNEAVFEAELAE